MINGTISAGNFGLPSKVFALTGTYSLLALSAVAHYKTGVARAENPYRILRPFSYFHDQREDFDYFGGISAT
jgi:hypothetical protein